jgi:hypothetical protein
VVVGHPGVQRDILLQLELSGPSALMYPTKLFHHCIAIGLRPVYVEVSSTFNCPLVSCFIELVCNHRRNGTAYNRQCVTKIETVELITRSL